MMRMREADCLESELSSPPVSPLGVVTDGVASPHPDNNHHEKTFPHKNIFT